MIGKAREICEFGKNVVVVFVLKRVVMFHDGVCQQKEQ